MINNVVLVSGVQLSDSIVHIHLSIFYQIFFPIQVITEYGSEFSVLYSRSLGWGREDRLGVWD